MRTRRKRPFASKVRLIDDALEKYESMQKGRVVRAPARISPWSSRAAVVTASRSPPQVELYGPPFTGKTATLMHVAVNGILPKSLGGNGMTVTWVDCDGRFSLPRFQEMAMARVRDALGRDRAKDAEAVLLEALASLRLYQLPSTRHLHELLRRIAAGETVLPGGMGIHKQMLILDPISAFYWIDTMESSEELRIFKRVCQLISSLDMAIFAAKSPLYMRRERDAHREYLGESWARLVKYRLVLWPELQSDLGSSDSSQPGRPPSEPRPATDRTQRRRPLAPELDEAGEEAGARRFGAQRLLPAGSDAQYSFVIGTAGINVLSVHSPSEGASAGSAHETSGSIRAW